MRGGSNIKKSFKNNLSWIFIGNLMHSILAFGLNIIVARLLNKNDYGIINYVASWVSFFNAFATLGINSIINKYYTQNKDKTNEYICTSMLMRVISSLISSILMCLLIFIIDNGNKEIFIITAIYSLTFIFSIGDVLVQWFRYNKEASKVAIIRFFSLILSAIFRIIALIVFKSLYWYIVGVAIESLIFSAVLLIEYRKENKFKIVYSKIKARTLIKNSYPFIVASIMSTIYAYTDKIMLQKMIGSEDVAVYSVSVTVSGIIATVASALIEGYRVEIYDAKNNNEDLYKKRLRQIYCILFWLCIAYGLFIVIFGKLILNLLYGEKYLSAFTSLSIIVWYTAFSYFGAINNTYMVVEGKQKWVQVNTIVGAACNIILNLIMIPTWGIAGAASASLITQFIANFGMIYIVKDLRPLTKEMINGIFFRNSINIKDIKDGIFKRRK